MVRHVGVSECTAALFMGILAHFMGGALQIRNEKCVVLDRETVWEVQLVSLNLSKLHTQASDVLRLTVHRLSMHRFSSTPHLN